MFAHYFKQGKQAWIIISETNRPIGTKIFVSGKPEAKKIAKENNAKAWNF